jgi:hypothetical protein
MRGRVAKLHSRATDGSECALAAAALTSLHTYAPC